MFNKYFLKKMKQYRNECKWYLIGFHKGFHLFGDCPNRLTEYDVKVLARSPEEALHRYMKRWGRDFEFNLHSNTPDETSSDWAKFMVIEFDRVDYEHQKPKFYR